MININIPPVIDEILEMIGISALPALAEEQHGLADKDSTLRLGGSLIDQLVTLPKGFNLRCYQSVAILCRDGEESLPHIVAIVTVPQFERKESGSRRISSPYRLLHRRTHLEKVISTDSSYYHNLLI